MRQAGGAGGEEKQGGNFASPAPEASRASPAYPNRIGTTPTFFHFIEGVELIMLTEEVLVQKFITVVEDHCSQLGELLHYCHVELVNSYWGSPPKLIQHFVVYYPNLLFVSINAYKHILRDFAKSLGISNAVCMNATRIIRDPASTLKQRNPVLWLELHWVAVPTTKGNSHVDQDLLNSD